MAIYLDTETTGFSPAQGATIVEVAIVDEAGRALIDTLVDPRSPIPFGAQQVHAHVLDPRRAACHAAGDVFGVAVGAVIDDAKFFHVGSFRGGRSRETVHRAIGPMARAARYRPCLLPQ